MQLRRETTADAWAIEALYDLAFAPGRTALSSYRLRDGVVPVANLGHVACSDDGQVVGAIRFWPVRVERWHALLLGPVAVHPTSQGVGLGALLIQVGLAAAWDEGHARVMLVGDSAYYRRFGFERLIDVVMPPPTNPDRVLGVGHWDGVVGTVTKAQD